MSKILFAAIGAGVGAWAVVFITVLADDLIEWRKEKQEEQRKQEEQGKERRERIWREI